jgi:hypothetical protein
VLLQSDYINNMRLKGFSEASIAFLTGVGINNLNDGIGNLWDSQNATLANARLLVYVVQVV